MNVYRMAARIGTLLIVLASLATGCQVSISTSGIKSGLVSPISFSLRSGEQIELKFAEIKKDDAADVVTGEWELDALPGEHDWLQVVRVEDGQRYYASSVQRADMPEWLQKIDMTPAEARREAGVARFRRTTREAPYRGTITFAPDREYRAALLASGYMEPEAHEWLELALRDTSADSMGIFQRFTADELDVGGALELTRNGISEEFLIEFHEGGYRLAGDELIALRRNGVSSEYAIALKKAGLEYTPDDLIKARRNGLSTEWIAGMQTARPGTGIDDMIKLRRNGIGPDLVDAMDRAWPEMTFDDIIEARRNGLSAEYLASAHASGYARTLDEAIELRRNGIGENFLGDMKGVEPKLSADEVIELRRNGIDADYYREAHRMGFADIHDTIEMRRNGLPMDYIAGMRKAGYDFTLEELIDLRRNGVPMEFAAAVQVEGREPLNAATLIDLRRKGLDAETVRKLRE